MASLAARRAACTHLTMERLYGDFRCNICHKASYFGWFYVCTQDDQLSPAMWSIATAPNMPNGGRNGSEWQSRNGGDIVGQDDPFNANRTPSPDEDPRSGGHDGSMPTTRLSPWIEEAIEKGHYTSNQIIIMREQKQRVVDTAKAAIERFEKSQTSNTAPLHELPTTLPSVDANPHLPFPIINEVQEIPAGNPLPVQDYQPKVKMFPHCKFRACASCRPTYRDRTWQCFEEALVDKMPISPSDLEESRPIAKASIVSKIGLRQQRRPRSRPPLRSLDSRALYPVNEAGQIIYPSGSYQHSTSLTDSTDVTDATVEPESKGFRESMKRALKGMLSRQSSSRSVRKRKAREDLGQDEEDFDMWLWRDLNDELLKEASGLALPGEDSMDELAREESLEDSSVDVGGVAVTEEAVDLGAADIIMSV